MGILFYDNGNINYKGNFMNISFDDFFWIIILKMIIFI
jgi:hypothetical protein